ncbi:MAG: SDR family oxidoreductase [Streptosporangiaceae bacterium]
MSVSLHGQVAIVTGASQGIGLACARALSVAGVDVGLVSRPAGRLREAAASLPVRTAVLPADVGDPATGADAVALALARFGRLDLVLPNAGTYIGGDLVNAAPSAVRQLLDTNVGGVMSLVRAALPHLVAQGSGDVLVTSSVSGYQDIWWEPVYSASKHAVTSFVHSVRRQLAGTGVRVGAIAPGIVLNDLWGFGKDADAVQREIDEGRGITSEDVADAVIFMLTRPRHVTIRDLVMLPSAQEI